MHLNMDFRAESFPVMPSRPCSFCLCLQGGSVFADFDTDAAGIVSLSRISFDGYGCCTPKTPVSKMSACDSRLLLEAIADGGLGDARVEELLQRYFRENKDLIWSDSLAAHDLL
jgi:hypothetical protein